MAAIVTPPSTSSVAYGRRHRSASTRSAVDAASRIRISSSPDTLFEGAGSPEEAEDPETSGNPESAFPAFSGFPALQAVFDSVRKILGVRPVAVEALAVDEESRRSVHAAPDAAHEVGVDPLHELAGLPVAPHLFRIAAGALGVLQQMRVVERIRRILLVLVDQVVHPPICFRSVRGADALRRFGGAMGARVQLGQREVAEHKTQPVAKPSLEHLHDGMGAKAPGTLEVAVLHERHRRARGAGDVIALADIGAEQAHSAGLAHFAFPCDFWSDSRASRMPSAPGFTPTGEQ